MVTLTVDPRTDVWTKFEEGRSKRSRVIDRKRKGYRQRNRPTDRQTDQPIDRPTDRPIDRPTVRQDRPTDMYTAICPLFFEGGHNKK